MECSDIQDRLEAFIEDDLPQAMKRAVEEHVSVCPQCRGQWMAAKEVRETLRTLPSQSCPAHVLDDVLQRTRPASWGVEDLRSILQRLLRPTWRPVAGLALMVALVLMLRPLADVRPPAPGIYTEQEILKAQEEAQWALAYVHRVMVRTQSMVQDDVIPRQVVHPIRNRVHTTLESIKEGGGKL